ncbi:receptor-type tyrosine-protein phosphatase T-like [Uloborus diversus]|uniref:receptor-type tyrosine-protein phosphatase T-like n=1 Tax=Uloborus diversus TaxID=327109 RepID=UPI00240945F2|nr:receptor-type tyrosine-protein phosphatase T-like [Uloborus diversus]
MLALPKRGQFDANFTLQNVWGRLQDGARSIIQCLSDDAHKKIKFSRKLDTGQGSKLSKHSQQFMQGKPAYARILFMPSEDSLSRFGVFQCKIIKQNIATEIVTLKLPPTNIAELDALNPYIVTSIGEEVELEVNVTKSLPLTLKWLHDGVEVPDWEGQVKIQIHDVQQSDAGIYECYYEGRRSDSVHAILRLIVRNCPPELYGTDCSSQCPPCYNGGVCHDKWGVCVCPAGFAGLNCEMACGGNHFGADCNKFCSPPQNNSNADELCASHLFCKPDPYGCSCAPGFKGPICMQHCDPGWYGADCKQPCHCAYGISSCNRITGACEGGCARGWRGSSCQIEDPNSNSNFIETTTMAYCKAGSYGPSCERPCRCAGGEHCQIVTGHCPSGCEEGWGGPSCGVCLSGRFGENCEYTCHCEGGHHNCDKDGFCYSGCQAGWAGFICQTECTPGRFGTNCASACHCHRNSSTPCDKITGFCEGDCEAGFMGKDCQTLCPQNTYGVNCLNKCICGNAGICNRVDGSCKCEGRWRGLTCNESEPQIIAASDDEVNVNHQVFVSCTADAVPEPIMNISSSEFPGLVLGTRSLEKDQYQAIAKVKPEKSGEFEFKCTARNQHGFDMKLLTLTVIDPPRLASKPHLVDKTNFSLTVEWSEWAYKRDDGGSPTDRIEYLESIFYVMYRKEGDEEWVKVDSWNLGLSIVIADLTPNTEYEIAVRCRRLGKGGEGNNSPSLIAKTDCGVPTVDGIPQEFLPDTISETTVTLTWKKPSEILLHCSLIGYYLMYHPEADESILETREIGGTENRVELVDLTPNTNYVLRLYPITALEKSHYFAELIIKTSETVPGPVTDLECQAVETQPDLLLVSWEAPSEVNGAIKGYVVTYVLVDRGQCGDAKPTIDPAVRQMHSEDTEITLQNLYPYSTYNVTVQAKTSAGEGDAVYALAVTAESGPAKPPPNVRVSSHTSRSLEFEWDPIPCEFANGIITHYEYLLVKTEEVNPVYLVRRKRSGDLPSHNDTLHVVEGLKIKLENLLPYTEYGFRVNGVTKFGGGPLSDMLFHRTSEEVPGPPRHPFLTAAFPDRLEIAWSEPEIKNGEIIRYRLQLWDHSQSRLIADITYGVSKEDGQILKTLVVGLNPATDFFIKIQASTSAGWGEFSSPVPVRTLDGVPNEPSAISASENGLNTINISWSPPKETNGIILNYKITYKPILTLDPAFNSTPFTLLWLEVNGNTTESSLSNLHPSTEYKIGVSAETSAGHGPEAVIKSWTVILGDHVSPSLRTVTVEVTNETIPIAFSTTGSTSVYKYQVIVEDGWNQDPIDESRLSNYTEAVVKNKLPYYIAAELDARNVSDDAEQSFVVGDKRTYGNYRNVHLNPGHRYRIRIRTLVFKDQEIKSILSEPRNETAAPTFIEMNRTMVDQDTIALILLLLVIMVFIIAITFLTVLAVYHKRRRKKSTNSFSTRDSGLSGSMTWSVMYKVPENESSDGPLVADGFRTLPLCEKHVSLKRTKSDSKIARGMRVETLEDFLANALATNQLVDEFKRLVEGQTSPWTAARKSGNLKKNRYGNILPYDRCRVVLQSGKNESDYINASYVDGYRRPREYIVTQGPLDNTIDDFWRMVWQENSPVIVMVTDLVENGKKKCAKYWPDDSMMCGDMQVLLIHSEENTDFIIRTILIRKMDEIRTHRVLQYQYTAWPDRTVPMNTNYFIKFLRRVRDDHPVMGGPMIVHCSAGAGRSGTFVAIDALCQQAAEDRRVDVFGFVNNARHQRVHLVQTLEQYTFIYEALIEAVQYEDTSISLDKIALYLKELNYMNTLDKRSFILKQYNKLNRTQKKVDVSRCSVALSEANIFKNRDPLTVPLDSSRIKLFPDSTTEEGSDYINAVFIDGYRKKAVYIATQMPMTHTVDDFWRMIYHYKSSLIIMLNGSDETEDLNIGIYWPEIESSVFGDLEVHLVSTEKHSELITRILMVSNAYMPNEEPHKVVQLQYKGWCSEMKAASMIKLVQISESWHGTLAEGPITVHCMDGATRSGLFIAAGFICDQVKHEESLDIFQVVKSIRTNRPEFIPNSDQYRFLFEVALEVAEPILEKNEDQQPPKKLTFKL